MPKSQFFLQNCIVRKILYGKNDTYLKSKISNDTYLWASKLWSKKLFVDMFIWNYKIYWIFLSIYIKNWNSIHLFFPPRRWLSNVAPLVSYVLHSVLYWNAIFENHFDITLFFGIHSHVFLSLSPCVCVLHSILSRFGERSHSVTVFFYRYFRRYSYCTN